MTGAAAQKLLERMRNSTSGWGQKDFEQLLPGYGFIWKEGKRHRLYRHPKHPELRISVPRHGSLKDWVARDAIKLIDELEKKDDGGQKDGSSK